MLVVAFPPSLSQEQCQTRANFGGKGNTETAGCGFRGGGACAPHQAYREFDPHSPIAYRRFGAWASGNFTPAYGSRFVRTAE